MVSTSHMVPAELEKEEAWEYSMMPKITPHVK